MTKERKERLVQAGTVIAVMLMILLLGVLIYQLRVMAVKKAQIAELEKQIEELIEERDNSQSDIEMWLAEWKIEERARQLGYIKRNDK